MLSEGKNKLFGTDGIRGVANRYPLTIENVVRIGQAAAYFLRKKRDKPRVVIGQDTRLSGYLLESALTAGFCSMGGEPILAGIIPTPGIAYLTRSMRADAGIVISASHNPYQDNGIKFFSSKGSKLPDEVEAEIEQLVLSDTLNDVPLPIDEIGQGKRISDAVGRYTVFLKETFLRERDLSGLKIVLDCAHGAAYEVAPQVFEELGAEVVLIGAKPTGKNINKDCGSTHADLVAAMVKEERADLGIALDGDADRAIMVDEHGHILDGDYLMAICARYLQEEGKLAGNTLVATVMSNIGLELGLKRYGIQIVRTGVGDRYVAERMLRDGFKLGGEQSGHIIFQDLNSTGDGILTALQVLSVMVKRNESLSALSHIMEKYPQILCNVRVRERRALDAVPDLARLIKDVEQKLGESGRILVRYSGTEPLLRIMIEGEDEQKITSYAGMIQDMAIQKLV
jgi:phosphoglucosamine mutase